MQWEGEGVICYQHFFFIGDAVARVRGAGI